MLPFWTNYLIRTYAWIVLLNREGLINAALLRIGLISEPLPLLYNEFAVVARPRLRLPALRHPRLYTLASRGSTRRWPKPRADLGASGWQHLPHASPCR